MTNHSVIIRVSYSMEHLHMHNSIRSICKQENTPRWSLTAVITWVIKENEMARTKRIEYISLPLEQLQDYHPHLRFAEWLSLSLQWAHEEGNTRWIQWILFLFVESSSTVLHWYPCGESDLSICFHLVMGTYGLVMRTILRFYQLWKVQSRYQENVV